jgi:hypothetical protein
MRSTLGKNIAPQMKTILCSLILITFTGSRAFADGYPFDPTSQQLLIDSLRVRLSGEQLESLSSTGTVTFTEAQLSLIRPFYPRANAKQAVIAATFNDNQEGLSDEDVDVFWTAAEEVAITLNPKVLSDPKLKGSALAKAGQPAPSDIRIAPDGRIFIEGRQSTMKDALALIERRSKELGIDHRQVNICVAPPYRVLDASEKDAAVETAFKALVNHGENLSVVVAKAW